MPALHFVEHDRLNQLCSVNEGRELLTPRSQSPDQVGAQTRNAEVFKRESVAYLADFA